MEKCQGLVVFAFCLRLDNGVIDPLDHLRIYSCKKEGANIPIYERPNGTKVI